MATGKPAKDKTYAGAPRLTPRPTAASSARAARNACNRNLPVQLPQKHSPSRISAPASKVSNQQDLDRLPSDNFPANITEESNEDQQAVVQDTKDFQKDDKTDVSEIDYKQDTVQESENLSGSPESEIPRPTSQSNGGLTARSPRNATSRSQQPSQRPLTSRVPTSGNTSKIPTLQEPDSYDTTVVIVLESSEEPVGQTASDLQSNENNVPDPDARSLAYNQVANSRPQTPKQASRPQTPRVPSRPSTPAHAGSRLCNPGSRPTTPRLTSSGPRTTSSQPAPISQIVKQSPNNQISSTIKEFEDVKSTYVVKQRQFHRMKKELDMKQQAVLEAFGCLRDLQERMTREGVCGGDEGFQQPELVVFNVADWPAEEVAQLCRDATVTPNPDGAIEFINAVVPIDENALAELDMRVSNVPTRFADLCLQAFTARQELIDWVKELLEKNDDGSGESLDRVASYNDQGLEFCEALRDLKNHADNAVDTITQVSRRACRERSALIAVGESLVRSLARLRQDLESRGSLESEKREIRAESETARALEEALRELEEERTGKVAMKEKLSLSESQLRQTRMRVNKMDRQLREAEASITGLTSTVKTLEDQSRQREVQLEARARKLKESLKTGEVASGHIAQQRDSLQAEVQALKEQIEKLTAHQKSTIQEFTNQIKDLNNSLEERDLRLKKEEEIKQAAQELVIQNNNTIEKLKAKITDLENSLPNPELPTEREMDLWAELQATKDTLRMTEDEVTTCKREKIRFLETLTKIAESENKVGMQQKLAAELLSKEEIAGKMQIQLRELTKNVKLNEQKIIQYEQYIRDLQAYNRAMVNGQNASNGINYQDLQQEILNLKMSLLEAVHRNEELSEMLMQKDQQLEQQDKTSRAQARVIKVREELINMLKNKETEQSRELSALQQDLEHRMRIVDEVNKQIAAKAEEIQELFTTLENKQQQIHRLEKIVLALEEQQRRAQAQRTRQEEKIAALEHEIAANGNRRERKFIFF